MTDPLAVISIRHIPMKCPFCGHECRFEDCLGDGDQSGTCPVPDCGGQMLTLPHMTLSGPDSGMYPA